MKDYKKKRLTISSFLSNQNCDDNEYNLPVSLPKFCYNFKVDRGSLIKLDGLGELKLNISQLEAYKNTFRTLTYSSNYTFKKLWHYKYYSQANSCYEYVLIGFGSDNKFHYINLFMGTTTFSTLNNVTFTKEPVALNFRLNGQDVIGFVSPSDNMLVWYCDENPYSVSTVPKFASICLHNNRLFAIDSDKNYLVRYSSNLNLLDWTSTPSASSGGSIELNDYKGQLKNLISFMDSLYVFRDFGISKISSYGNNSVFYATNVYNSSAKIYCDTACICGTNIYFLSEDGLYKFDGYNVDKVDLKIINLLKGVEQTRCNTAFFEGKLYIACKLNFDTDTDFPYEGSNTEINNALIIYDIENKTYDLMRGVDVVSMLGVKDLFYSRLILSLNTPHDDKLFMIDGVGKIESTPTKSFWQSGKVHFEKFDKDKILKEINFISNYDVTLKIETEGAQKTFSVTGKSGFQRVRVNLKGKTFNFSFTSTQANALIKSVQFVFSMQD